jgi:hypothetical protein
MRNAASFASSSSTNFAEYEDLPGHHLLSIRNLIASSPNDSYPETVSSIADDINFFMDNFTAEEAEDYSGGLRSRLGVLHGPACGRATGQRSG